MYALLEAERPMISSLFPLNPRVLVLDGRGAAVRWSRSFQEQSGLALEALRENRAWTQLFEPSDVSQIDEILADGQRKRDQATGHFWNTAGAEFDTAWSALTIPDPGGSVAFVVLTGVRDDIEAASPSRSCHDHLLGTSPLGTWAFDRGTYGLVAMNDLAAVELGYCVTQVRSMRMLDLLPWEEVPRLVELVTDLASGEKTSSRWRQRRKDGSVFDVETDVVATESVGRPLCLVVSRAAREPVGANHVASSPT